jgi:hypothetical protein
MNGNEACLLVGAALPTVPAADALALEGGRIGWVGRREQCPERYRGAAVLDCAGRAVLPGFIDAHTHIVHEGLRALGLRVPLAGCSREEALERLADAVSSADGASGWIVGVGWDETEWERPEPLTRAALDRLSAAVPIAAFRVDGHVAVVNGAGVGQLPTEVDRALVDAAAGTVLEAAAFALSRGTLPGTDVLLDALDRAATIAHALGITSVHAMAPAAEVPAYVAFRPRRGLRVRVYAEEPLLDALRALGIDSGYGDRWTRLGGAKLFADGSIGAGNAAVGTAFADSGGRGALNHTDAHLEDFLRRADAGGLQTAVHAIGDRAIEQLLRAHEAASTSSSRRHRIEHIELPTEAQLDRAAALGLALSMQPNFIGRWSGTGSLYERRLGRARDAVSNPLAWVATRRMPLGLGSDGMPLGPLYGIHSAVHAPFAAQRLSVDAALDGYTRGAAWLGFEEEEKGRLAPGLLADLTILDRDPRCCPEAIDALRVELTILEGRIVHRASSGWGATACWKEL